MAITDSHLLLERPHSLGGVQRIYRFKSGYGLSVVNAKVLRSFAWEIAVLKNVGDDGSHKGCCYDTPLTEDVEVFMDDEEANAFIDRAALEIGGV